MTDPKKPIPEDHEVPTDADENAADNTATTRSGNAAHGAMLDADRSDDELSETERELRESGDDPE